MNWISVKDQLPNNDQMVLVYMDNTYDGFMQVAQFIKRRSFEDVTRFTYVSMPEECYLQAIDSGSVLQNLFMCDTRRLGERSGSICYMEADLPGKTDWFYPVLAWQPLPEVPDFSYIKNNLPAAEDIKPTEVVDYLIRFGWHEVSVQKTDIRAFRRKNPIDDDCEVIITKSTEPMVLKRSIYDAAERIAEYEHRTIDNVMCDFRCYASDKARDS